MNFLASRDKYIREANVIALPSASASVAWTKTLILAISFKPEMIELSYCICVFLVTRPFIWYHNYWPCDLLLKNFNLGCYLVMVAAWRALLSSENSYAIFVYLYVLGPTSAESTVRWRILLQMKSMYLLWHWGDGRLKDFTWIVVHLHLTVLARWIMYHIYMYT